MPKHGRNPESMLDKNEWHHIVGVYDGGSTSARIYLDGELIDAHFNAALAGIPLAQIASFGNVGTLKSPFEGSIDETAVWLVP